ncbi:enoyl-CoA hydratase/isomerase family protein [soil metagenome]
MDGDIGEVRLVKTGHVATVVIDHPQALNAMTQPMYRQLAAVCDAIAEDPEFRVAVLRGTGGKAFVSGSDISQFTGLDSEDALFGSDRALDAVVAGLERLAVPTIAVLEGWVMGAGLVMASTCDLRIATPDVRMGVPIARTLGNVLSSANTVRLIAGFGVPTVKRILLLAQTITASEGVALGFLGKLVEREQLDNAVAEMTTRLVGHAPLTMEASKETIRRSMAVLATQDEDLVRLCYGSQDFQEGVAAFLGKRTANWVGR